MRYLRRLNQAHTLYARYPGPVLLTLDEALADRERQDTEFKKSTAEWAAAAQALVGFANSRGGQVFFGVTDAGVVQGIEVGGSAVEDLSTNLDMRIYPSLPLEVDYFPAQNNKRVVRVWVPGDKPPIVGGYVYSKRNLSLDDRVALAECQAFRRVGRQTRKVEFMWLRGALTSDPLVMIDHLGAGSTVQDDYSLHWDLWHVSGGVALELTVTTDPPLGSTVGPIRPLPASGSTQAGGNVGVHLPALRAQVDLVDVADGKTGQFWLVARYHDEWGCEWESRRRISISVGAGKASTSSTPEFSRRIVSLPPKRLVSPR